MMLNSKKACIFYMIFLTQASFAQDEDAARAKEEKLEKARQVLVESAGDVLATASDRNKPGRLSPAGDISFSDMQGRWERLVAQNKTHEFSTVVDKDVLRAMARTIGCEKIIGILPTGFPQDTSHKQKLNGATLFARCSGEDYAILRMTSIKEGGRSHMIIVPESFNSTLNGNPARQLYFKSEKGLEKTVVVIRQKDYLFTMDYWSQDKYKKEYMTSKVNAENIANVTSSITK